MASVGQKRLSIHRRLEQQERQIDAMKRQIERLKPLANTGAAAYMIAHEINNLLTPIKSYASLALQNLEDGPLAEKAFTKAVRNCGRVSTIMDSMFSMANGQGRQRQQCRVAGLVEEVFKFLARDFSKDGIEVRVEVPAELEVCCVRVQIEQVLMNLILNARDAMLGRGGLLSIGARDLGDTIQIEVTDTGEGIAPENLENIFEMFFTTRTREDAPSENSGAGLGLAFCREIADAHNGTIQAESELGRGSTFRVTLPKAHPGTS
ncbi:MAG: HAMP domain-containing histidine kinase [Phycisphaerales bacterium]|nr:MAG: HAMP domain-containing histidine kinase [Phycisphaerales bacterium]